MIRFNTFRVAVLLGLVSSQVDIDPWSETQAKSPTFQSDFEYRSSELAMSWDTVSDNNNAESCIIYEDLTLFNLYPIRGPYYIELDLLNDSTHIKEKLEVHFCGHVLQNESNERKRSLVYLRNTDTTESQL